MEKKQRQNGVRKAKTFDCLISWRVRCACRLFFMILFVCLFSIAGIWTMSPRLFLHSPQTSYNNITNSKNATTTLQMETVARSSRYIALGVLFICIAIVFVLSCCNESFYSARFRLLLYATFTILPIQPRKSMILKEQNSDVVDMKMDDNLKKKKEEGSPR